MRVGLLVVLTWLSCVQNQAPSDAGFDAGSADAGTDAGFDGGCVATSYADACQAVRNAVFASVSPGECGLCGPSTVCMCTWHVTFTDPSNWQWQHSDFGMYGTYSCSGYALTASGYNTTVQASYDPACDELTWDGVRYRRAP